jgi:hypothetical protein
MEIFVAQPPCHAQRVRLAKSKVLSERENFESSGILSQPALLPKGRVFTTPVVKTLRCFAEEHAKLIWKTTSDLI